MYLLRRAFGIDEDALGPADDRTSGFTGVDAGGMVGAIETVCTCKALSALLTQTSAFVTRVAHIGNPAVCNVCGPRGPAGCGSPYYGTSYALRLISG